MQRKCWEYLHREQYIHYALDGVHSAQEQSYATIFAISGMVAMLEQWVRGPQGAGLSGTTGLPYYRCGRCAERAGKALKNDALPDGTK